MVLSINQNNKNESVMDVWDFLLGFLPKNLVIICTVLAFLVPYSVFKVNQKLHENGDPPWKKDNHGNG
jgi:hypothetical protein